jgi:hypothetical protein
MNNRELVDAIALELAKVLPSELLQRTVATVLEQSLQSLCFGSHEITKLVTEAVTLRAKELLQTKYKVDVDRQAEILAARVVGELPRLQLEGRR